MDIGLVPQNVPRGREWNLVYDNADMFLICQGLVKSVNVPMRSIALFHFGTIIFN